MGDFARKIVDDVAKAQPFGKFGEDAVEIVGGSLMAGADPVDGYKLCIEGTATGIDAASLAGRLTRSHPRGFGHPALSITLRVANSIGITSGNPKTRLLECWIERKISRPLPRTGSCSSSRP